MTAASPAPRPTRVAFALWLDVGLFVAYLLVHTPRSTGVFGHEALGVALAIPLLVHLLLSWRWIASKVTRALAPGALRTRVNVLINAVLFASMVVVIVSGVVVSRELLPSVGLPTVFDRAWFRLHDTASNVLFVAVALHLAMNWGWIVAAFRRRSFGAADAEANAVEDGTISATPGRSHG